MMEITNTKINWKILKFLHRQESNGLSSTTEVVRVLSDSKELLEHIKKTLQDEALDWTEFCIFMDLITIVLDHAQSGSELAKESLINIISNDKNKSFLKYIASSLQTKFNVRRTNSVEQVSLADLSFIQSSFEQIYYIIEFVFNSIDKFNDKNDYVITKRYLVEISNLAEAFGNSYPVDEGACLSRFKSIHRSISHLSNRFSKNEGVYGNTIQDGSKTKTPCDIIRELWSTNKTDNEIRLLPNKISGYTSVQEYLDIHYNLLQEDFLYPLKQDLELLKNVRIETGCQAQFHPRKLDGLWYHGPVSVHRTHNERASNSLVSIKIKFDTLPIRIEDLETSKKLLTGSLVFMICDNKTIICATVSSRDEHSLIKDSSIEISPVASHACIAKTFYQLFSVKKFHLFESSIYFEAYNHVLKSLDRMKKLPTDLERYLVNSYTSVDPPEYLQDKDLSKIDIDISCLYYHKNITKTKRLLSSSMELYKHLHEKEFENQNQAHSGRQLISLDHFLALNTTQEKNLLVNESQLKSIQSIFNHRIGLIQGPPGTGKSFVGKLLLNILLKNRHLYDSHQSPILLVCYTNRALDSFLEDMLDVTNKIIRIGGRSKSELLEVHNLAAIKKVMRENRLRDGKLHGAIKEAQLEVANSSLDEMIYDSYDDPSSLISDSKQLKWKERSKSFERASNKLHEINLMEDVQLLEIADIIGLTTNGAAKNSKLLKMLVKKCKIVLIEEAGQVLESHVVTSLPPKCKQLILIGDHQQLRPSISTYHLGKNYGLDISLFERLIKNNYPYTQLLEQHRMRPEIAKVMSKIFYKGLRNHPSVMQYPLQISGFSKNMFFLTHNYLEEGNSTNASDNDDVIVTKSKVNTHEALMLLHLTRYLLANDYKKNKITILTTYLGQFFELKKLQSGHFQDLEGVCIQVVDNFQGEENDIILLSLVRSNMEGSIGFLSVQSRVCVALSRARMGLYVIGNMNELASASTVWRSIQSLLKETGMIGESIRLFCKVHNKLTKSIKTPQDFETLTNGRGCEEMCNEVLRCGHICDLPCHVEDRSHSGEYGRCKRDCEKSCSEGHPCKRKCYERCNPCEHLGGPITLECGHVILQPCPSNTRSDRGNQFQCNEYQNEILECGHSIQVLCSNSGSTNASKKCLSNCEFILPCGHPCDLPCHFDASKSSSLPTHHNKKCLFPCKRLKVNCRLQQHVCDKLCYQNPCDLCTVIIPETTLPHCKHVYLNRECHQDPNDVYCTQVCGKNFKDCSHVCKLECGSCQNQRIANDKLCKEFSCPPCQEIVEKNLNCGKHTVLIECSKEPPKCSQKCDKIIPECGHPCKRACGEPCGGCDVLIISSDSSACGHGLMTKCGDKKKSDISSICEQRCHKELRCGHVCERICGIECIHGKLHAPCKEPCQRRLICGHECNGICGEPCLPCEGGKRCIIQLCPHKKCKAKCEDPCKSGCKEKCGNVCPHNGGQPCTKKCGHSNACSGRKSKHCEEVCGKLLKCGHSCKGYCGQSCPTKQSCPECNEPSFDINDDPMNRYVTLTCGHSIKRKQLNQSWMKDESIVEIASCVVCGSPISFIGKGVPADIAEFMMYKKEAVVKVFEEYFVLKSSLEQKKKDMSATCKEMIANISNCTSNEDSTKHANDRKLIKYYTYMIKRCEDKRNLLSFAEFGQLEMKHWILQNLYGTSKNTKKLTHVDRSTIIDGITSTGEMVVPGEDVKALNIGNIGMEYVRNIITLLEDDSLETNKVLNIENLCLPKNFVSFSRGSWKVGCQEENHNKEEMEDREEVKEDLQPITKLIARKKFHVYFDLY